MDLSQTFPRPEVADKLAVCATPHPTTPPSHTKTHPYKRRRNHRRVVVAVVAVAVAAVVAAMVAVAAMLTAVAARGSGAMRRRAPPLEPPPPPPPPAHAHVCVCVCRGVCVQKKAVDSSVVFSPTACLRVVDAICHQSPCLFGRRLITKASAQ